MSNKIEYNVLVERIRYVFPLIARAIRLLPINSKELDEVYDNNGKVKALLLLFKRYQSNEDNTQDDCERIHITVNGEIVYGFYFNIYEKNSVKLLNNIKTNLFNNEDSYCSCTLEEFLTYETLKMFHPDTLKEIYISLQGTYNKYYKDN